MREVKNGRRACVENVKNCKTNVMSHSPIVEKGRYQGKRRGVELGETGANSAADDMVTCH